MSEESVKQEIIGEVKYVRNRNRALLAFFIGSFILSSSISQFSEMLSIGVLLVGFIVASYFTVRRCPLCGHTCRTLHVQYLLQSGYCGVCDLNEHLNKAVFDLAVKEKHAKIKGKI